MRQDKLTTKLQEALADAQSSALGNDNPYIEPVHLLTALLNQDDGSARSLLQRAGVNVGSLTNALNLRSNACRRSRARAAKCRSGANCWRC